MTIKESAVWVKQTKKGDNYLSISVTLDNDEKLYINVFKNTKTKDTQPDFKSIQEKPEPKAPPNKEDGFFSGREMPRGEKQENKQNDDLPF
jgi:hypothetical protein